ncbi:competence/damage-inducible protein A [Streptococcus sp.]|nr:competence/damage-inducible protein A [Streptococcus sp.]MDY3824675.1 competence/damage-inducible protein A [Streptococcus sp.]
MKAELIAVGTEILTGQIVNTNAQFLSEQMAQIGIDVYFQTAVGDNMERLLSILDIAKKRSDLIILCGGLGPTEDDLTKQTLAQFLNRELVTDLSAKKRLDEFFSHRPSSSRTPNNERQAQIIEGSTALQNRTGLAVGGLITVDGTTYVVLPGPPGELKPMVREELLPLLDSGKKLYSRVLRFFGMGESQLVTLLDDLIQTQTDPTLAPYAKTGEVTLRLSTKAKSQREATLKLDQFESKILEREPLSQLFYAYGDDTSLSEVVVNLLKANNKTITAAESLTAGLFQASLADISGASQIFSGGFVTYSMEEKSKMLGINMKDLAEHGVVSSFTAQAMAEGAREKIGADFAISLTGVAGPEELEGQAVGTVFIALASVDGTEILQLSLGGRSRSTIRRVAVLHALNLVRQTLLKS